LVCCPLQQRKNQRANADLDGERKENDEQWRGQSQSEYRENGINGSYAVRDSDTESQRAWEQSPENRGGENRRFDNDGEEGNVADTSSERMKNGRAGPSEQLEEANGFISDKSELLQTSQNVGKLPNSIPCLWRR
jgi:hypothetical protein